MSWLLQSEKNGYARLYKYHGLEDSELKLASYIPPGKIQQNDPSHPVVIPKPANQTNASLRPMAIIPVELTELASKNSETSRKYIEAKQTFQNLVQELKINKEWSPPKTPASQNNNNDLLLDKEANGVLFGDDFPKLCDFDWKPEFDDLLPNKENISAYIKSMWKVKEPKTRRNSMRAVKYPVETVLPPPMETDDLTIYAPVVDSDPPWKQIPRHVNITELIRASKIHRAQSIRPPEKTVEHSGNSYQPLPVDIIPQVFKTKSSRSQSQKPKSKSTIKVEKLIPREIRRCYDKPWLLNKVTDRSKIFKPPKPQNIADKTQTVGNQPLNSILKTKEVDPLPPKKKNDNFSGSIPDAPEMAIRNTRKSRLKSMKPIRPIFHELYKYQAPKTDMKEIFCRKQTPFTYTSIKAREKVTTEDESLSKSPSKSTAIPSRSSTVHRKSIVIPSKGTVTSSQRKVNFTSSKGPIITFSTDKIPPSTATECMGPSWPSELSISNGSVSLPAIRSHNPLSRVAASQSINITNSRTTKKLEKPGKSKNNEKKDEVTKKVKESQMFSKEWVAYIKLKKKLEKKERMKRKLMLTESKVSRSTTPAPTTKQSHR